MVVGSGELSCPSVWSVLYDRCNSAFYGMYSHFMHFIVLLLTIDGGGLEYLLVIHLSSLDVSTFIANSMSCIICPLFVHSLVITSRWHLVFRQPYTLPLLLLPSPSPSPRPSPSFFPSSCKASSGLLLPIHHHHHHMA